MTNMKQIFNRKKQEIVFLQDNGIDPSNLPSRWGWMDMYPDLIPKFYRNVIYPFYNRTATIPEINQMGFKTYVENVVQITGKTFNKWVSEQGFKTRYKALNTEPCTNIDEDFLLKYSLTHGIDSNSLKSRFTIAELRFFDRHKINPNEVPHRWDWLDFKNGLNLAIVFIKEVLSPIFGRVPYQNELKKTNYTSFPDSLQNRLRKSYNQVLEIGEFEQIVKSSRSFEDDDITENEREFHKHYNLEKELNSRWSWMDTHPSLMVMFFNEVLIKIENRVPSKSEVIEGGYSGFLTRIQRMENYSWEQLVIDSGNSPISGGTKVKEEGFTDLELNFFKKYGINKSNMLYRFDWLDYRCDLAKNFLDDVLIPLFGKVPNRNMIRAKGFGGFPKTLKKKCNLTYLELIESAGHEYYINLRFIVGHRFHRLLNDQFTLHFLSYYIKYFVEPNIYPSRRPDGLLIVNKEILNLILENDWIAKKLNINSNNFKNLKLIIVEITSDLSDSNLVEKVLKYQHQDVFLFIVGYKWYFDDSIKTIPNDYRVLFSENIRILSVELFAQLIGISEKQLKKIKHYEKLAENHDIKSLKQEIILPREELFHKDDLKKELINLNLIEDKISEYLNFDTMEYETKTDLISKELEQITKPNFQKNKVAIIDIETTGFSRKFDKIIEIGIIELDINTKEKKILFNSPIYEKGVELFEENEIFKKIYIDYEEVINAPPLELLQEILKLIFENYRVAAFNSNFDLGFLKNRGFRFPKKLRDIMKYVREIIPKTQKYNFQDAYRYMYNLNENRERKYLSEPNYIQQHRAIDDAMYEAELLCFLYYEFNYPLDFQTEITDIINDSDLKNLNFNVNLNCNQFDGKLSCSRENKYKQKNNKDNLF